MQLSWSKDPFTLTTFWSIFQLFCWFVKPKVITVFLFTPNTIVVILSACLNIVNNVENSCDGAAISGGMLTFV